VVYIHTFIKFLLSAKSILVTILFVYAYAAVEYLLLKKQLQWRDCVLRFAPKPYSRRSVARPALSAAQNDKSDDNVAARTGDDPLQQTGASSGASAWSETFSEHGSGVNFPKEENVIEESSPHTGSQASAVKAEVITDVESSPHTGSQASAIKAEVIGDVEASLPGTKNLPKVEVTTDEISTLASEKLKLLKKLIEKKKICKQCKVKVDPNCEAVTLEGTEEDIITTKFSIFEALARASECSLDVSKSLGNLITSSRGQQWFDDSCEQFSFLGICYVDNSVTKLLAADDTVMDAMRKWLAGELCSERKSFKCHHLQFLQTVEWMDFVKKLTDSQLLVIATNDSKMEILIEGPADVVKIAVMKIDDLLNRECQINKKLKLKPADFRTLSFRCTDIVNKVQELR